jgi:hypothetical protein
LQHQTTTSRAAYAIKEIAKEDRESWRVVKPSESDKVSVSEEQGFEEIDVLAKVVEEPHSLCQLSTPSAVIFTRETGSVCKK